MRTSNTTKKTKAPRKCDICDIEVAADNFARHIRSTQHRKAVSNISTTATGTLSELADHNWTPAINKLIRCLKFTSIEECNWQVPPKLYLPTDVWGSDPPRHQDIHASIINNLLNGTTPYTLEGSSIGAIIANLDTPFSETEPMYAFNLRVEGLKKEFKPPNDTTFLNIVAEHDTVHAIKANAVTASTFVDLHIDSGEDGLAMLFGNCEKIWLMYPPTEKNLGLMQGLGQLQDKFVRIAAELEHGVIVKTDRKTVLHVPSGCIHAVFTISGGFLVGIDVARCEAVETILRCLQLDYHCRPQSAEDDLRIYSDTLRECLSSNIGGLAKIGVESWIKHNKFLEKILSDPDGIWEHAFRDSWNAYLNNVTSIDGVTPVVFRDKYLRFLYSGVAARNNPRKRRR